MAGQVAAEAVHWFELPDEVWEVILENLESSNDIINVLNVFPHLQGQVMKNIWQWRMDHVLFFLLPWLDLDNILALRQVSKRWLRGVDNLIQNHPNRRPYQSGGMEVAHLNPYWLLLEESAAYFRISQWLTHRHWISHLMAFDRVERIMGHHHPQTNRAITRHNYVYGDWCMELDNDDQLQEAFWNRTEEFLRKVGDHISHLDIAWNENQGGPNFLDRLSTFLGCVPQLKALLLKTDSSYMDQQESGPSQSDRQLPELPELETLDINVVPCYLGSVVSVVINCYAKQIRRLVIHPVFWRMEYGDMFPQLMELILRHDDCPFGRPNLITVLSSLNAPKLVRLELMLALCIPVFVEEVIPCLVRFPVLRKLLVSLSPSPGMSLKEVVILSSIKCLEISQQWLRLEFLVSFPNLEHLRLEVHGENMFGNEEIYSLEAWEALRKLKEITQVCGSRNVLLRHTRAKYDLLKEEEAAAPENIFRSFRQ